MQVPDGGVAATVRKVDIARPVVLRAVRVTGHIVNVTQAFASNAKQSEGSNSYLTLAV